MSYCNTCGSSTIINCNCQNGCPLQLDFECVLYHKSNNSISELDGLNLSNGSTLELVIETVDEKIKQLNVPSWNLSFLRTLYTINTLQQFGEAVNTQFSQVESDIISLQSLVNLPITPVDSQSINLTTSGTNNHTLRADITISPDLGNLASISPNGLYVPAQTLSVNYTAKTITISNGNTINLTSLCGCADCNPYLGAFNTDPTSPDEGKYWYNTVSNQLKIQVNGSIKIITTT